MNFGEHSHEPFVKHPSGAFTPRAAIAAPTPGSRTAAGRQPDVTPPNPADAPR